ncbi:hypothetical protein CAC02_04930 [Streptococcus gallolyticus]|uniref:Signal peptide containing protein n=1 Tax=Streptococcus gallolyticus TaxID=315405 RepID=A0A368UEG5_9STRE|nr:hypothetical protein [Streptococcus gallolyticus]RCW17076.1 hypothetical protein CAC02_04930 [Streptococcus gallolyticus]
MLKKVLSILGFITLVIGALAIYNVEATAVSEVPQEKTNYTIKKIVDSYQGKEYFTKDYIDEMFEAMDARNVSDDTKIIADSEGGLFCSTTDNHAVSKTYDENGNVVEELSLDSPKATTVGELKEALYEALE